METINNPVSTRLSRACCGIAANIKLVVQLFIVPSNVLLYPKVTTHSHLMSHEEIMEVSQAISVESVSYDLHEFDTELDFSNKLG